MKKEKGITLVALAITIIVLIIITGITITAGKNTIQKAKLEELKTNMLLIQAKAKEYVEEANFRIKKDPDNKENIRQEIYTEKAQLGAALTSEEIPEEIKNQLNSNDLEEILEQYPCYLLTEEARNSWGLDKIEMEENEKYIIQFNEAQEIVEIYNTIGYQGKYSLHGIMNIDGSNNNNEYPVYVEPSPQVN